VNIYRSQSALYDRDHFRIAASGDLHLSGADDPRWHVSRNSMPPLLEQVRQRLEARCDELTELIAAGHRDDQPVSPDKAIGRLTRQDALQQQQMSAELIRRHERERVQVQAALRAMDEGTYGVCQRCEAPIGPARLHAMPHARLCIGCAEAASTARR
jgi:DnaK suppressor protein